MYIKYASFLGSWLLVKNRLNMVGDVMTNSIFCGASVKTAAKSMSVNKLLWKCPNILNDTVDIDIYHRIDGYTSVP